MMNLVSGVVSIDCQDHEYQPSCLAETLIILGGAASKHRVLLFFIWGFFVVRGMISNVGSGLVSFKLSSCLIYLVVYA